VNLEKLLYDSKVCNQLSWLLHPLTSTLDFNIDMAHV